MIGEIDFYKAPDKDYRSKHKPGQLFYAPMPFLLHSSVPLLKLDYYDKAKPYNSSYMLETVDSHSFRPKDVRPIYPLGLSSKDFVLGVAHKFRPVIILSHEMFNWKDYEESYATCSLVAPLYRTKDDAGNYKFSENFILRVQAYEYPTLFYLPEDNQYGISESLVRFERITTINQDLLKPMPVNLSDDALYCLTEWFLHFLGAELDEILALYREGALEQLEEN